MSKEISSEEDKKTFSRSDSSWSDYTPDSINSYTEQDYMTAAHKFKTRSGMEKIFALNKEYNIDNLSQITDSTIRSDTFNMKAISSIFSKPKSGLSKVFAALYILASFCGNGDTYLPFALMLSNFAGFFMLTLIAANSVYCGLLIGWCRIIIEERWPECKENTPSPYPKIGLKAVGKWMEYVVTIVLNLAVINWSIVLASHIASMLEELTVPTFGFCSLLLIITLIFIPLSFLNTLKDLWVLVLVNTFVVVIFWLTFITAVFIDKESYGPANYTQEVTAYQLANSFGMFTFIVSSCGVYPSIQDEMLNRRLFSQSVAMGNLGTAILYLPIPLLGYAAYGTKVNENILRNIHIPFFNKFLNFFFSIKMIVAYIITLNPLYRNIESILGIPKESKLYRQLFRTSILVVFALIGLLVQFNIRIFEVVGAASLNILTFQFPVIFYVCLVLRSDSEKRKRSISKKEWCVLVEILLVSNIGGIFAIAKAGVEIEWFSHNSCYTAFLTIPNRTCIYC